MGKIIFILGGARSGKSDYAMKMLRGKKGAAFIATCEPLDKEMKKRICLHRISRPKDWRTYEIYDEMSGSIKEISKNHKWAIADCMTLLISNLIMKKNTARNIEMEVDKIITNIKSSGLNIVIVSNEVGLGIVPDTRLGRDFRDIAGRANQKIARAADKVYFMVSGLPWRIK